jgi:hypothetical protein
MPAHAGGLQADSLKIFPAARNRKHPQDLQVARVSPDGIEARQRCSALRPQCLASVFCTRNFGETEKPFRKGKLKHDLPIGVGYFQHRTQQAFGVLGFQQFLNHHASHFPCAIGIPQLFALVVSDQFAAYSRVEVISRHPENLLRLGPGGAYCSQVLYSELAIWVAGHERKTADAKKPVDPALV